MFSENFEKLCEAKGLKRNTVVKMIGLADGTAYNWEANGTIPRYPILLELASKLDCQVADFFIDFDKPYWKIGETGYSAVIVQDDTELADLLFIYRACTKSQRSKLMGDIYEFEEKVLNP